MKISRLFLLILMSFSAFNLMACGEGPSSINSPVGSTQFYPQYKKAEDLGYIYQGYICSQVVTSMYNEESHTCVLALDSCQGVYLTGQGFRADSTALCELAQ